MCRAAAHEDRIQPAGHQAEEGTTSWRTCWCDKRREAAAEEGAKRARCRSSRGDAGAVQFVLS
jgi:hypothetical protein